MTLSFGQHQTSALFTNLNFFLDVHGCKNWCIKGIALLVVGSIYYHEQISKQFATVLHNVTTNGGFVGHEVKQKKKVYIFSFE